MPPCRLRTRSRTLTSVAATTQKASSRPKLAWSFHAPVASGTSSAITTLIANAQRNRRPRSGSEACFQRASGPMPIRNTSGVIKGTNTVSK